MSFNNENCVGFGIISGNPVDGFMVYLGEEGKPFQCEADAAQAAEHEHWNDPWWIVEIFPIDK